MYVMASVWSCTLWRACQHSLTYPLPSILDVHVLICVISEKATVSMFECTWVPQDTRKRLFVAKKERGHFHHSSFLRGVPLVAAGGMRCYQGKLIRVTAMSGHYKWVTARVTLKAVMSVGGSYCMLLPVSGQIACHCQLEVILPAIAD